MGESSPPAGGLQFPIYQADTLIAITISDEGSKGFAFGLSKEGSKEVVMVP